MKRSERAYPALDEKIVTYEHPSGLHVQVIPKPGFYKKFAVCSVNFGSVDTRFILPGEQKITTVPDGVAHFLEHKLFEQPDMNVMDQYLALGASPNAATSFMWTYYYFTCTSHFEECFRLLTHYVQNPYFTEENTEKEKGIIAQEINMYRDSPEYIVGMNAIDLLYHNNPIKTDIAGTVESIGAITADTLKLCHRTFYHPSNMVITVVGDLDPDQVAELAEQGFSGKFSAAEPKRIFDPEPSGVRDREICMEMDVSMPLFSIAFKDAPYCEMPNAVRGVGMDPKELVRREVAGTIAKNILFGRTSSFYEDLYNQGLINSEFYADYDIDHTYAMASIGGESPDPWKVREFLQTYLARNRREGLDKESFERIRNAASGKLLKRFNVPESLGKMFSVSFLQGVDPFDYFEAYGKISYDDVMSVFEEVYFGDMVTSVVKGRSV